MSRVLVVDDDPHLLRTLRINLTAHGHVVVPVSTGAAALRAVADPPLPDVVVLDLGLPDVSGLEVLAGIRGWSSVPVIVLSARDDAGDKVAALDTGADDYVTKPFGMPELLARIRAAVRRAATTTAGEVPRVSTPDFDVDLAAKKVVRHGAEGDTEVHLSPTEWAVLEHLVRHPGMLVTQQELLREVWGPTYRTEGHYLRVYLGHLRRKLEPEPARPRYLITEPGRGYRFEPAVVRPAP